MSTLLPALITYLQQYGYPALWLGTFVAAIGAPLPISFVLLAAGAFAAQGDFSLTILAFIAISASASGDTIGYFIGHRAGNLLLNKLAQKKFFLFLSPKTIERSRIYFTKREGWAIFLSRFLFSAFGSVINLLAGAETYPYHRFLLFDICGETLGALIPLLLGYTFGASWEAIGNTLTAISAFVTSILFIAYLTRHLVRMLQYTKDVKLHKRSNTFIVNGKEKTKSLPP